MSAMVRSEVRSCKKDIKECPEKWSGNDAQVQVSKKIFILLIQMPQ